MMYQRGWTSAPQSQDELDAQRNCLIDHEEE